MNLLRLLLAYAAWATTTCSAFDYEVIGAGELFLSDVSTGISGIRTIFVNALTSVAVDGIEWNYTGIDTNSSDNMIKCDVFVDGNLVDSNSMSLDGVERELPSGVDCGNITVAKGGRYKVSATVTVDSSEASTEEEYEAYGAGVAIIPLCVILLFAVTTHMVEFSLFVGIWIGACIITGSLAGGFIETLDNYLVSALADVDHVYVILFTLFLSGLVAMMEKSGGMFGFTRAIAKHARTPRSGQLACYTVGVLIFFDDYANTLLAGKSLRPLLDSLYVSREKLAFIVDATAAPIASISPVSSWVGFEVGLIQAELDKIIEQEGTTDIGIKNTGFAVFLQSIKYRYYPIFMLVLMLVMIIAQRDFATMLIAERKTEIYQRTDGGDAATEEHEEEDEKPTYDLSRNSQMDKALDSVFSSNKTKASEKQRVHSRTHHAENDPYSDTPLASWNMLIPIAILIFLIFWLLVKSGEDPDDPNQTLMEKIENSDSYYALLIGTMAAAMFAIILYLLQIVKDGKFVGCPSGKDLWQCITNGYYTGPEDGEEEEPRARFLMSVRDSVDSHVFGYSRVFPALIVLTLAWASGDIMIDVGADRLFAAWIAEGVAPEMLPTLSFIISMFMALATGTSWGTMTILFPLLLVPTYNASDGDEIIFYAVVAGILSGSVAGDHMSPISDTTVLSSLATDCNLLAHVATQAPYVLVVSLLAVLVGTVPIGYKAWPNIVGILLGFVMLFVFTCFLCAKVIAPSGRYDILTELILKCRASEELEVLKEDCIKAAAGEEVGPGTEGSAARGGSEAKDLLGPKHVVDEDGNEVEQPHDPKVSFSGDEDYLEEPRDSAAPEVAPDVAPSKSEEEET